MYITFKCAVLKFPGETVVHDILYLLMYFGRKHPSLLHVALIHTPWKGRCLGGTAKGWQTVCYTVKPVLSVSVCKLVCTCVYVGSSTAGSFFLQLPFPFQAVKLATYICTPYSIIYIQYIQYYIYIIYLNNIDIT